MKTITLKFLLLLSLAAFLISFEIPAGWFKAGSKSDSYDMGIDKGSGMDGKNAASIKSIDKTIEGYGTLMQSANAEKFIGKRIRLSGYIKSVNVSEKAGFWLRVGQANSQNFLAFDNMMDRAVSGTTEWKKYEIVLDVPEGASQISYGALLRGTGQIWFDKISFEVVDTNTPTTGKKADRVKVKDEPMNLDFEE